LLSSIAVYQLTCITRCNLEIFVCSFVLCSVPAVSVFFNFEYGEKKIFLHILRSTFVTF